MQNGECSMMTTVFLFANLREIVGMKSITLDLPAGVTVAQVKVLLTERMPALSPMMNFALVSINREYATDEQVVPENAEVAIFPPVSGG
jgi:molybdopterin converting factor subunit 1